MVLSMTGFASKTATLMLADGSEIQVTIDVKTLNSRFFEATCKLSHAINHLETEIISLLKPKLLRGHAYVTIILQNTQALHGAIKPSVKIIEGYVGAIDQIKKSVSVEGTLSINDLLLLPDIFETEKKEIDTKFEQQLLTLVGELADKVTETRKKEGSALKKDLEQRFTAIEKEISSVEKAATVLMENKKKEVAQTIKEIDEQQDETFDARKSALYISLDKMDIHEEIVRFKSHLKNIKQQLVSETKEKGKRLDFTLQELAREVNTLSSKCSDASITAQAINIKVDLEKSREQTQNIV